MKVPAMLTVSAIRAGYADLVALHGVSLDVRQGEAVALVGSNGSGKTTTLRAVTGLVPLRGGSIEFMGARLDGLDSAAVAAKGIAHVPEGSELFPSLTVEENLLIGARTREARQRRPDKLDEVFALFPRLRERRRQIAGTLSGGERQMCAIGRGLMACPKLLVLDEPSLGLAPVMVASIFEDLRRIRDTGLTILLVEQHVDRALRFAERAFVLENGRVAVSGASHELLRSKDVQRAYLGM